MPEREVFPRDALQGRMVRTEGEVERGVAPRQAQGDGQPLRIIRARQEDELAAGTVSVKALREGEKSYAEQTALPLAGAAAAIAAALAA